MKKIILIFISLILISNVEAKSKVRFSPASDPAFKYMGRVLIQNDIADYNWPGVSVSTVFEGNELGIRISGGTANYFNIWIDEKPCWVLHAPVDSVYWYPEKLKSGKHFLRIVKRTEADMGRVQFYGIYSKYIIQDKAVTENKNRRLLVIGNSITCGYGTEGANKNEHFKPSTENCEQSYATILGRAFYAEYQLIAHSGLGVIRNYGDSLKASVYTKPMPKRLEYLFDNDSTKLYDLKSFVPDGIIINLGTNDFSTQPHPDEIAFKNAYHDLLLKLTDNFPEAKIFCLTGPMINEPYFQFVKEIADAFNAETQKDNVVFIGIPTRLLNNGDDLGSDYHPSFKGQLKSADHVIVTMSTVLGWDYQDIVFQ